MKVLTKIQETSKTYEKTETVDCRQAEVGEWFAQGDNQVTIIEKPDELGDPWPSQQVAHGTTKGSRHVFDERVKLYHTAQPVYTPTGEELAPELVGPVCYVETEGVLLHPEHRHGLFGKCWAQITYQRDMRFEEIRRVAD